MAIQVPQWPFHSDRRGCGTLTQIFQTMPRFWRMRQLADRVNPIVNLQASSEA